MTTPEHNKGIEQHEKVEQAANKTQRETGIEDLKNLLINNEFIKRFSEVAAKNSRDALSKHQQSIEKAADQKLKPLIEEKALEELGLKNINDARKLGKQWGEALRAVSQVSIVLADEIRHEVPVQVAREQALDQIRKEKLEETQTLQQEIETQEQQAREQLLKLQAEVETRAEDPNLLEALDTWGRSRDSQQDRGPDGNGYNAGVIHYFEYRSSSDKGSRIKEDPLTIDGFIDYTKKNKQMLDNPEQSSAYAILGDELGQQRLYAFTEEKQRITGFKKQGDKMRIISVVPGKAADLEKLVKNELADTENKYGRLSSLGNERRVLGRS